MDTLFALAEEYQVGVEYYGRGFVLDPDISSPFDVLKFSYYYAGVDLYSRGRYSKSNPKRELGLNLVVGVAYGDVLGTESRPNVRYQLNYYDGLNPHGQFRQYDETYLGFDVIVDF